MFSVVTSKPFLLVLPLLGLVACKESSATAALETRVFTPLQPPDLHKVSSRERLGVDAENAHGGRGAEMQGEGAQVDVRQVLSFTIPQGWSELPPAPLRMLNLRVAGDPKGECYVTFLSGAGGGLKANLDRWRVQFGLAALSQEEIDKLPTLPMFGQPAPWLFAEGEFTAFDGTKNPGFALAGVILPRDGQAMTVKFTGPKELVQRELPNWKAFVASLGPAKGAQAPASRPAQATPPVSEPPAKSALSWTAPAGWKQAAARPMREATFVPDGAPGTECWVSVAMGSLEANLLRWRGQFGKPPFTTQELGSLPTWNVLGVQSRVVEIQGTYKGAMDSKTIEDALMIGVVCERSPQSIFVRITGPRAEVERERANFESFCKSLR